MLYSILLGVQVLLAIGLVTLILLQHGKGADAGAAFGSGASATVFGARGSGNALSRATALTATAFFLNSLALAFLVANRPDAPSVVDLIDTAPVTIEEVFEVPERDVPPGSQGAGDVPN